MSLSLPCRWALVRGLLVAAGLAVAAGGYAHMHASANAQRREELRQLPLPPERLFVDPVRGRDTGPGTKEAPLATLAAALARLPDPVAHSVTIELTGGRYDAVGTADSEARSLGLMCRMRPGTTVKIIGRPDQKGRPPVLAWEGSPLVDAREGDWWLENVQIGSGSVQQRRGVMVSGTAHVTVKDVTFRTRSVSDAGIYVERGGQVLLRGTIRLNEHLHEQGGEETFCGIIATTHGIVRFAERQGASLDIGNGSLSASYYGIIRLGCETARITSWSEQSNNLAINNSGRIDLHDTTVRLCARQKRNTPIGLEHDGHILGEGARVIIEGENNMAVALQKASTFTCNALELRGKFEYCLWATSGSMFVGRFLTDVGQVEATTGANINIEKIDGKLLGPAVAKHCGTISLPDRNVFSE